MILWYEFLARRYFIPEYFCCDIIEFSVIVLGNISKDFFPLKFCVSSVSSHLRENGRIEYCVLFQRRRSIEMMEYERMANLNRHVDISYDDELVLSIGEDKVY